MIDVSSTSHDTTSAIFESRSMENEMAKKIQLKTAKTKTSVTGFLNGIADESLRRDCKELLRIFKKATGLKPVMWGDSIIGFGEYTYYRSNGDEGRFLACGFSPRKSGPTLYIMPGYNNYETLLKNLGPHKLGKSCLYLKSLEQNNTNIIATLIKHSMRELKKNYETTY